MDTYLESPIKTRREELGMTATKLAAQLNVGRSWLCNVEYFRISPSEKRVREIAEILRIDADEIRDAYAEHAAQRDAAGAMYEVLSRLALYWQSGRAVSAESLVAEDALAVLAQAQSLGGEN